MGLQTLRTTRRQRNDDGERGQLAGRVCAFCSPALTNVVPRSKPMLLARRANAERRVDGPLCDLQEAFACRAKTLLRLLLRRKSKQKIMRVGSTLQSDYSCARSPLLDFELRYAKAHDIYLAEGSRNFVHCTRSNFDKLVQQCSVSSPDYT